MVASFLNRRGLVLLLEFWAANCSPMAAIPVVSPPRVYQDLSIMVSERKKRENILLRKFLYR